MAGYQDLRPAATVSDGLRIGKDIEATFSTSGHRHPLDVVAFLSQVFFKPFCALNLIIGDRWYVDKIFVQLIECVRLLGCQWRQRGSWRRSWRRGR